MTLRYVQQTVVVMRKGNSTTPPIGAPFDFTDDEIAQIEEASPDALSPVNIKEAEAIVAAATGADGDKDDGKKAGGKGSRKSASKAGDDDDDDL